MRLGGLQPRTIGEFRPHASSPATRHLTSVDRATTRSQARETTSSTVAPRELPGGDLVGIRVLDTEFVTITAMRGDVRYGTLPTWSRPRTVTFTRFPCLFPRGSPAVPMLI